MRVWGEGRCFTTNGHHRLFSICTYPPSVISYPVRIQIKKKYIAVAILSTFLYHWKWTNKIEKTYNGCQLKHFHSYKITENLRILIVLLKLQPYFLNMIGKQLCNIYVLKTVFWIIRIPLNLKSKSARWYYCQHPKTCSF